MEAIYKVTSAGIGETKRGYKVFKLMLNNSIWATKLVPLKKTERKYNKLYQLYEENRNLDFLIGKYISISVNQTQYGFEFSSISSFDALQDFKKELDVSNGSAFSTKLPISDFLLNIQREQEEDGSIKITSDFGDMRVSKLNGVNICYQYDTSDERLNLTNIDRIFDAFYKDVSLPPSSIGDGGAKSYYKVSVNDAAIVQMDNHVKVSYKMTTSGDYDRWHTKIVQKIGDKLPGDQIHFIKNTVLN